MSEATEEPKEAGANEAKGIIETSSKEGFGKGVNDYLIGQVTLADTKSSVIVAASLVIMGVLLSYNLKNCLAIGFNWAAILMYSISVVSGAFILFPRLPSSGNSPIFWRDILQYTSVDEYQNSLKELDSVMIEREYAKQNYFISSVLQKKFFWIRCQVGSFVIALLINLVTFIIE